MFLVRGKARPSPIDALAFRLDPEFQRGAGQVGTPWRDAARHDQPLVAGDVKP
jgi:hypothetical protein